MVFSNEYVKEFPQLGDFSTIKEKFLAHKHINKNKVN